MEARIDCYRTMRTTNRYTIRIGEKDAEEATRLINEMLVEPIKPLTVKDITTIIESSMYPSAPRGRADEQVKLPNFLGATLGTLVYEVVDEWLSSNGYVAYIEDEELASEYDVIIKGN